MLHMTFYPIRPWMASPHETRFWDVQEGICAMPLSFVSRFLFLEYNEKTTKRQLHGEKENAWDKTATLLFLSQAFSSTPPQAHILVDKQAANHF